MKHAKIHTKRNETRGARYKAELFGTADERRWTLINPWETGIYDCQPITANWQLTDSHLPFRRLGPTIGP